MRGSFLYNSNGFTYDGDADFIFFETFFDQFPETRAGASRQGGADAARVPSHDTIEGDGPTGHGGDETERGSILLHVGDLIVNHVMGILLGETYFDKFLRSSAEASRRLFR